MCFAGCGRFGVGAVSVADQLALISGAQLRRGQKCLGGVFEADTRAFK